MADFDAPRPAGSFEPKAGLSVPKSRPRINHDTGESSRSSSSQGRGTPRSARPSPSAISNRHSNQPLVPDVDDKRRDSLLGGGSLRRIGRPKSGGGFLLHESISGGMRPAARGSIRDVSRASVQASQTPRTPQSPRSTELSTLRLHDKSNISPRGPEVLPRSSGEHSRDVDSAQIVQMALNLSESRRIASQRHASRATPPRLGPLPDGSQGSKLRQHFEQRRKLSHDGSPKILQASSSRLPSATRIDDSLPADLEGLSDTHYHYQFSSSTLARAQRAKDHLELMAHYRRLLDVLPPLKSGFGPNLITSPPGSATANKPFGFSHGDNLPLGRQYNPLQYIRNRKVRAREREVIDGDKQDFGDVDRVKAWVDQVVERATSFATSPDDDDRIMPKYPGADNFGIDASGDSLSRTAPRARRPRVDWFVEPCDIIADAYWVEQGNHKELIENRHWRKIFPPAAPLSRPISRDTAVCRDAIPPFSMEDDEPLDSQIRGMSKVDSILSPNSAKDRAKQTLHNIRAFPHRHNGHNLYTEFMQHKKDSASDVSGSENDTKRALSVQRRGTEANPIASKVRSEEHMLDMTAKDAQERVHLSDTLSEAGQDCITASADSPKDLERTSFSKPFSRFHSRKGSMVDTSDSGRKLTFNKAALASPVRYVHQRQSLDTPDGLRKDTLGKGYSVPTSPELRPTRDSTEPGATNHISSSWSRSGSPHRNPISKMKKIIRDKAKENEEEQEPVRRVPTLKSNITERFLLSNPKQFSTSNDSYAEQVLVGPAKAHHRTGSTRLPADDAAGSRGLFKAGPRIDTVIRGGVSKLGDMFWKRDGVDTGELSLEFENTDESDNDKWGGRSASCTSVSRRPSRHPEDGQPRLSHCTDNIPQVKHASNTGCTSRDNASRVDLVARSAGRDRDSSRYDTLRSSQVDEGSASSSALPESLLDKARGESDESDLNIRRGGNLVAGVGDEDKRPSLMRQVSRPEDDNRSFRSRHWSIADKGTIPTEETRLTRREIARMRALVLSTGIKAMEINRRAQEAHRPLCPDSLKPKGGASTATSSFDCANLNWSDIAKLCPEAKRRLSDRHDDSDIAFHNLYSLAGRSLSTAIQNSSRRWQASADQFTGQTTSRLRARISDVRSLIANDLSEQSRRASDLADETNRDLALGQPLKVKAVVDMIEKMLRRRRRRLRWIRRALWLTVEWLLVGFMWYVWFMVMILRVFLGIGKGLVKSARWLLWL